VGRPGSRFEEGHANDGSGWQVEPDPVHDHLAVQDRALRRPPLRRRQDEHVGRPAKGILSRQ
jgi:hypothetical protein